ncbi:vesicle-associated protein 3-1-like [Setaria viridis]|uniref:vesicle-associated protein 3-1-like n=1 Tax=Setaria viridis TaxID=4556 RepID=UPI00149336FF|nr:vesicle-associated protein 3-1-like [Setaria viridis]
MEHDPADRPDISDIVQELNEIDSNDHQFQVIPSLEDMLGIEPLEIQFPFEHYWQVSHTVELSNDTDDHFAFVTKPSLHRLRTEPDKGIVPPRSKCSVTVTMMQAQVMVLLNNRYKEEITVLSTRLDGGLSAVDITKGMFMEEEGKVVDEVNVMVVLGRPPLEEES